MNGNIYIIYIYNIYKCTMEYICKTNKVQATLSGELAGISKRAIYARTHWSIFCSYILSQPVHYYIAPYKGTIINSGITVIPLQYI